MSYIQFVPAAMPPKAVTRRWVVETVTVGEYLGEVKWFPAWRQYAFSPSACSGVLWFEQDCLREIAQFVEDRTREHKEARRRAARS